MEKFVLKNGLSVTLRNIVAEDYETVMAYLHKIATETTFTKQYPNEPDMDKETCINSYEDPNRFFLGVFTQDKKMIGLVNSRVMKPNHPWSGFSCGFDISLLKDYYGLGLGFKLMQKMEIWARDKKMHSIRSGVRTENLRAISLYLKCGFQIDGLFRDMTFIDGKWRDLYHISKILD